MSEIFSTTPSPEAMEALIRRIIKGVYTHLPAIITSFDPDTQIAKVVPVIQSTINIDNKIRFENLPELIEVPVLFCHGKTAGFSLTMSVSVGDECLLSFSMKSFDNWHETGEIAKAVEPIASRTHNISDAIAFVGLSSKPNVISDFQNDCIEIRNKDRSSRVSVYDHTVEAVSGISSVKIDKAGLITANTGGSTITLSAAGNITMTPASGIVSVIGGIIATEDIVAGGNVKADGGNVTLLTHKHSPSGSPPVNPS